MYGRGFSSSYVHNFAAKLYYLTSAAFVQITRTESILFARRRHRSDSALLSELDIFDIQASSVLIITRSIFRLITKTKILIYYFICKFLSLPRYKKMIIVYMEYLVLLAYILPVGGSSRTVKIVLRRISIAVVP